MNLPTLDRIADLYLRDRSDYPTYAVPRCDIIDVLFYTGHAVVPGEWDGTSMHGDEWRQLVRDAIAIRERVLVSMAKNRFLGNVEPALITLAKLLRQAREVTRIENERRTKDPRNSGR